MATDPDIKSLAEIVQRSVALDEAVMDILGPDTYETCDTTKRILASFAACSVSMEHARALRTLIIEGLPTSAVSLMRLQYEALTRSAWLCYAASEKAIDILDSPPTPAAEKAASKLPSLSKMLDALAGKAPPALTKMFAGFKDANVGTLNSFVHGGMHPLRLHDEGYPLPLLIQIVRRSNAVLTMSGMMMAILSGDADIAGKMSKIQPAFRDCLPELLPAAAG